MSTSNDVQEKTTRKRRGCLGCLGRAALGALAFLAIGMVAGAIYQAVASSVDVKKYPPPGKMVRVGELDMHLHCTGEGSPTVILEAGAGSPSVGWVWVQEKVAEFTRVCSYDRPGFGWSSLASEPLSPEQVAATLHELLAAAGIPGPYVLVGHSDGGVYARSYRAQFPSDVAGMVLVDSSHESQNLRFPPAYLASLRQQEWMMKACQAVSPFGVVRLTRLWTQLLPQTILSTQEGAAVVSTMYRNSYCQASANELEAVSEFLSQPQGPASLGDLPLVVISSGLSLDEMLAQTPRAAVALMGEETFAQIVQISHDLQADLVNLSTQGRQVIAEESTHNIQWDQPDLVADAIREIVDRVRGN